MASSRIVSFLGRAGILLLKLGVTGTLIAYLVIHTDLTKYIQIARGIPLGIFTAVVLVVVFQMAVISALRLKLVLAALDASIKLPEAARITWCGFFVEQVGAIFIAGDVARILLLRQVHPTAAVEAPLLDRIVGLLAIAAMASVGAVYIWREALELHLTSIAAMTAAVIMMAAAATIVARHVFKSRVRTARVFTALSKLPAALLALGKSRNAHSKIAAIFLLALATHILNVVVMHVLFNAVGAKISLTVGFMVTPLVMLVAMIPASIAGWGVREGAFVVALQNSGLASEHIVAASILFGLCVLVASLPGAIMWMISTSPGDVTKHPDFAKIPRWKASGITGKGS